MNIDDAITALGTRDLINLYCSLTGKTIAKFATRAKGEQQTRNAAKLAETAHVRRLLKNLGVELAPEVKFGDHSTCPKCAAALDARGVSDFAALAEKYGRDEAHATQKHQWQCLLCGAEWGAAIVPAKRPPAGARGAAISRSWGDPAIAAKRKQRHSVVVVDAGAVRHFKSVPEAFKILGLPMGRMIAFRMRLKAAGKLDEFGYSWTATLN